MLSLYQYSYRLIRLQEPLGIDDWLVRRITWHCGKCEHQNISSRLCLLTYCQNFWDPDSGLEFHYNKADITCNPAWWYGEPVTGFVFITILCIDLATDVGDR
jgi:hypothetical protein